MKRLHINLKVTDLQKNIAFYSGLFGAEPTVVKSDYAKWLLNEPSVNFAITLGQEGSIEHLGIQVEEPTELDDMFARVDKLEGKKFAEGETICCYAKSNKTWVNDPQGIEWEIFRTHGESESFHGETAGQKCC
jgi:catechol 2,3-dioxygenase-like lactoylglutathione lyase family enzyme